MRGDKDMRRLAEIEANLLRSPLDRLETHEHRTERRRLRDEIYGPTKRGGDRRSERFQNERGFALKSPILSEGGIESIERRSEQLSIRLCKLLSAEERSRLKGTAVANRDKDLFAIASIGNIQQRTAARSRTPRSPRPPCTRRSIVQDLPRIWNAIPRRRPSGRRTSCSESFSGPVPMRWSGFCVRSQIGSSTSSKFCPRW